MSDNNNIIDEIITNIKSNFTEDNSKNFNYAYEESKKYKGHPLENEIVSAINELMETCVPDDFDDDDKEEDDLHHLDEETKAIFDLIKEGKFQEALPLSEQLVAKVKRCPLFRGNMGMNFVNYDEDMEWELILAEDKNATKCPINYGHIYYNHAQVLLGLGRINEAETYILLAMEFSPTIFTFSSELSEIQRFKHKTLHDDVYLEEFYDQVLDLFDIAFRREDVAKCYRSLSYYFSEKQQFDDALCCLTLANILVPDNEVTISELAYIQSVTNKEIKLKEMDEIEACSKKYGFPIGPNQEILNIAYNKGNYYLYRQHYDKDKAIYFFSILYNLTGDDNAYSLVEDIEKGEFEPIEPIKIPRKFKRDDTLDLEEIGLPNDTFVYQYHSSETFSLIYNFEVDEKQSMPFNDDQWVINKAHDDLNEITGLIEVGSGMTKNGKPYVYDILKHDNSNNEDYDGMEYTLNLNVKVGNRIHFFNCSFAEGGITGQREAEVMILLKAETGKSIDELLQTWSFDPYFPDNPKGFLMNQSEDKKYDKLFKKHPLSEARSFIKYIVENN